MKPWLSAEHDNKDISFLQIGSSFLRCPAVKNLSGTALRLYLAMCCEGGKYPELEFSAGTAERKYGIAGTSFDRAKRELIEAGFIEQIDDGRPRLATRRFRLLARWKF